MISTICNIIINLILAILRIKRFSNSTYYLKDECMTSPQITYSTTRIRKIITWNTNGIFISFNNTKLKKIIKTVHSLDADLICLQECFDNSMKDAIIENLKFQYPFFLTGSLKKRMIIGEDCGLLVLSKLPINHVKFYNFRSSTGIDGWFSNKGVLYFTVDGVNFANTHTQSEPLYYCSIDYCDNPSVSKKQIREIIENSPFGRNFILMGDLNNTYACNILQVPENNNDYTFIDDKMCYDYIVNLRNPDAVSDVSVIRLKDNPSDHYPVVGYI